MIKTLAISLFFLLFSIESSATHIVGGEISYSHLGGNSYELTLIVYRDDYNGSAGAVFDDPASVWLYTDAGVLVDSFEVSLFNPGTANNYIPNPYPNPCLDIPVDASGNPTITIQKGIYKKNITVPNGAIGYHLIYARCCRNGALINNLTNPADQGAKYTVYIPPTITYNNNSPSYDVAPPIFVCLGSPLSFDQSATDSDGDSLVYSMCSPLQGLDAAGPQLSFSISPPSNFGPPFVPVVWGTGYDENDPLGGVPLTIDQNTGLLSGTPVSLGSFVVGICVSEFRNGVFLSTVLRDFQYTVTNCNIPTANIPIVGSVDLTDIPNAPPNLPENILGIYTKNCEQLNVDFDNTSTLPGGVPATATNADYFWAFGDGTTSTDFEPVHLYPDTGVYIVKLGITVTLGGDICTDTGYYVVFVYPIFDIDFSVDNSCILDSSKFIDMSTTASYDATNQWEWNFGDFSPLSLEQNPIHKYNFPGTYQVILFARTEKGCTKIDTSSVTIYPTPQASFLLPSPICLGDTKSFISTSTLSSGTIDSTFWDMSGSVISYSDSFNTFPTAGTFPIQLVSTSSFGCIDSISHNLLVNPLPIITTSGNDTICPFTTVQVSALGGISYSWSPATFMSNPIVFNPIITPITERYYNVSVTDNNGCVNDDSIFIAFKPLPPADAGEDTSVCLNVGNSAFNQSVPLQATGGILYSWSPVIGLNNPVIPNPIATPLINTDYIVTVTDLNNCTNKDTVTVIVLDPSLGLIKDPIDSLCLGDTVFAEVLDQGSVSTFLWSPINFVTNPTINQPGFFPPINTQYILTVQNYCYTKKDTILIDVTPTPAIDAGLLDSICLGDPAYQLNANPTNYDVYNWSSLDVSLSNPNIPNPTVLPTVSSKYHLSIIDFIGTLRCENSDSVEILVFNNPTLNITTPPDYLGFICLGDSILLKAISNDAILYQWDLDTTLGSLNTDTTIASPIDTQQYFITVENIHSCTARDSITINVQKPINASMIGDSLMCEGFYVNLEATGGLYYHWFPNSANFSNPSYSLTQAFLDTSMRVFVDVSNDCFNDTFYQDITVNQLPVVDAGEDKTIIRDDFSTILDGSGDGKPLWYSVNLNFYGLLNSPAQYSPEAQPIKTTTYVLEIENPITGCKNYDTMTVTVEVLTLLAFPTAFSPNGDGVNDLAYILKHLNIESLDEFSIFNRQGEMVFTTNKFYDSWDGTYKGVEQGIGVFVWKIGATTKDGEKILKKGNITLLR